jgi:cytoskeleton bundling-enhancing protein CbeA-like protein
MKKDTANEVWIRWWGLKCDITPHFGARLVQEGNRLHYLADRASITGQFSEADLRHLDQAFPC